MRVSLVAGAWSSNIGNAFFNLGAEWLLRDIGCLVRFFPESPRWKKDVKTHFDVIAHLDCDAVVLNGPCLHERLAYVYRQTFSELYSRGIKVGYLSAGMSRYDREEAKNVVCFLREFPPLFVCTRDAETAEAISGLVACPVFNGICTSMFLNDAINPVPIVTDPYIVLNFDGDYEPELSFDAGEAAVIIRKRASRFPDQLLGREVVRTSNLSIDEGYARIYRKPNTYHSDLPYGYCSVLKYADLVLSERVHTCTTALVYGSRAVHSAKYAVV